MNRLSETQKILLSMVSVALFGAELPDIKTTDCKGLEAEAIYQAVSPLVYSVALPYLSEDAAKVFKEYASAMTVKSIQVSYEHYEVHNLMTQHNIPYVTIKGEASASYYKDPSLRTMGDVDFLVHEEDMQKAGRALEEYGFQKSADDDGSGFHVAYSRKPRSNWELHRSLNGIPAGREGDLCREYLSDIIETATEHSENGNTVLVPDTFHHGLILLLHTASHLTSSGIGLRHLCDWAVFAAKLSDDEFTELFEEKLKKCGLWQFARLLTLTSVKYLGAPPKGWAGKAEDSLLENLIADIMNAGNFGQKDADRFRQIKYIANRGEYTVDGKGVIRQAINSIDRKAKSEHKSKAKVVAEYASMVMHKQRKPDSKKTLAAAKERKEIYKQLDLFKSQ